MWLAVPQWNMSTDNFQYSEESELTRLEQLLRCQFILFYYYYYYFEGGGGGGMWKVLSLPPDEAIHPASPMILIPSYHWNSIDVYLERGKYMENSPR